MISDKTLGNVQIEAGKSYDTGAKFTDSSGSRRIMNTQVDFGALPNATTKNVAHGASVDPDFATATIIANNGSNSITLLATADGTNVSITTTTDLSAYSGIAIIEHVEA